MAAVSVQFNGIVAVSLSKRVPPLGMETSKPTEPRVAGIRSTESPGNHWVQCCQPLIPIRDPDPRRGLRSNKDTEGWQAILLECFLQAGASAAPHNGHARVL